MATSTMESAADRQPRAGRGQAPDVFVRGGWQPMREHRDEEAVDFAIVGAGAGGATLACQLAKKGFSVVCFDAGPYWRPLEDFASDETEQQKLYWTDERISGGADPIALGGNNSGKGVGGSTVHFSMISLRLRPEWFQSKSLLGYGADWPITVRRARAVLRRRRAGAQRCPDRCAIRGGPARRLPVSPASS